VTFAWPYALVLVLVAPLLLLSYLLLLHRRRRFAVSYASLSLIREALPKHSRWRRHLPFALFLAALISLALAAARPQAVVAVPMNRMSIILALDVSRSMCATDVAPNRLTVAQQVARQFVEEQDDDTPIGIVAFSGLAQLVVPPTTDRDVLVAAIDGFNAGRGTAIGSALLRSIDAIAEHNPDVPRASFDTRRPAAVPTSPPPGGNYEPDIIVLLTDGATTQGVDPIRAAAQAAERRIRVYSIGFGTTRPAPLSCSRDQLGSDVFGNQFGGGGTFRAQDGQRRSAILLDEETLQTIADTTGGTYHRAADADQLVEVFRDLPSEVALQEQHTEISFGFVAVGALLATLAVALSIAWNRYS
jgi:Ca-activated chloride channel family protein